MARFLASNGPSSPGVLGKDRLLFQTFYEFFPLKSEHFAFLRISELDPSGQAGG
jgi:hypothetical protein